MSSSVASIDAPVPEPVSTTVEEGRARRRPVWLPDAAVAAGYLALALLVTWPLWRGEGVLRDNRDDPIFFQWMLAHAARIFTHGDNPFFAEQINAPFGLNLMANTSVLGLAIPLVPVTLLFGPYTSFLVMTTTGLAGTAYAWYFVLSRHLVRVRAAAVVGGVFCGFAPGMISQVNGHPNIVSQFLVPFIVLTVLRLREPDQWRRNGFVLAGLVIYQTFINEEVLFVTAFAMFFFALFYLVPLREKARPIVVGGLKAFGACLAVSGPTLAFPLWWQFFGPAAYHGLPVGVQEFGTDLMATKGYARESLLGSTETSYRLASSGSEENTFFGTALLFVMIGVVVVLVRGTGMRVGGAAGAGAARVGAAGVGAARALIFTLILFWLFSLGPHIRVGGKLSDVPGPWFVLARMPLFDSVVPTRLGLVLIPMIGVLLALSIDRFGPVRLGRVWTAVVVAALLPIAPTPISVSAPHVPATPAFVTSGEWRRHVPADGVVLALPPGWVPYLTAMNWQVDQNLDFSIVGGYYLAPRPDDPSLRANFGPMYPHTMGLLWYVGERGGEVYITDEHRRQAAADLRAYRVTTMVLPATHPHADDVREVADRLVGVGRRVDDAWVWDVRAFVAAG